MNNKEAIRRTQRYLEALEQAIAQPIPEASAKELDEIINDPEGNEEYQAVICLWKEVIAPLDVAIALIYNNRVLPQYKEQIVNYVAEKGYIENSPSVKSLFAYRLSGYNRPEGDISPIVWNGNNGKSYELIYTLRYLCDRASYQKMRRFFTGPEWVKEKDSSYAISADSNFKLRMSEFYPGTCPF